MIYGLINFVPTSGIKGALARRSVIRTNMQSFKSLSFPAVFVLMALLGLFNFVSANPQEQQAAQGGQFFGGPFGYGGGWGFPYGGGFGGCGGWGGCGGGIPFYGSSFRRFGFGW